MSENPPGSSGDGDPSQYQRPAELAEKIKGQLHELTKVGRRKYRNINPDSGETFLVDIELQADPDGVLEVYWDGLPAHVEIFHNKVGDEFRMVISGGCLRFHPHSDGHEELLEEGYFPVHGLNDWFYMATSYRQDYSELNGGDPMDLKMIAELSRATKAPRILGRPCNVDEDEAGRQVSERGASAVLFSFVSNWLDDIQADNNGWVELGDSPF